MDAEEVKKILREARERIERLMAQEKWVEAHRACLEILRFNPENIKIIRLKNKIENSVRKLNRKALKEDLKKLVPLWRERKYDEIMPYIEKLEPYAADYGPLNRFIIKVRKEYKNRVISNQKQYLEDEINHIKQLAGENNFPEAVRLTEKLRVLLKNETELKKLLTDLRSRWINHELNTNKTLLESQNYEDILLFLQGLLRIDYRSLPVKKLIEKIKKRYQMVKVQQKKELIYKELSRIKTMYQLKKYYLAMDSAKDVLDIDPSNREAKTLFLKAKKQARKKQDREIREQMKTNRNKIKDRYKKNKKDFIRI
jgi:hypothetical protein